MIETHPAATSEVNDTDLLLSALSLVGIEVTPFPRNENPDLYDTGTVIVGFANGRILGDGQALLKATHDVCKLSFWVPFPPHLGDDRRQRIATALLKLNFRLPFGRIGMEMLKVGEAGREIPIAFPETMFFWKHFLGSREPFIHEVHSRLHGLCKLRESVQKVMGDHKPSE